jgi:transposase
MEAMPKHRSHSIEFKRQIAQEFIAGETLHGLAKRHDVSRNLIRIWVKKLEAGAFDEDARAADLLQEYRGQDRRARAHGRQAGTRNRVSKGGAEKRTTAEKRDYIRHHRPHGVSVHSIFGKQPHTK